MSDQPPVSPDEPERVRPERQTAAERRGQETVILSQDNLTDMVSQAKDEPATAPAAPADPAVAPPAPAAAPAAATATAAPADTGDEVGEPDRSSRMVLILGTIFVLLVIGAVVAYALVK